MDPELVVIMKELDMAQYISRFTRAGFESWKDVCDILESDLEQLGVKTGHRRRLQRRIATSRGFNPRQQLRDPHSIPTQESTDGAQTDGLTRPNANDGVASAAGVGSARGSDGVTPATSSRSGSGYSGHRSPAFTDGSSSSRKRKSVADTGLGQAVERRTSMVGQDGIRPSSSNLASPMATSPQSISSSQGRFQPLPPPPAWPSAPSSINHSREQDLYWGAYLGSNDEMEDGNIAPGSFASSLTSGAIEPMLAMHNNHDPPYSVNPADFAADEFMFEADGSAPGSSTDLYFPPPAGSREQR